MSEVIIIGLDIAKYVFHVHGADERGRVIFSKRISRGKLLDFFAAQPNCTVALEVREAHYVPLSTSCPTKKALDLSHAA